MENPREHTIEVAVADRLKALRLNRLSLEDIEAVKSSLPDDEYEKLKGQFTLQRHFIETSIPHIEAFLRYWIQRKTPSGENLVRLDKVLLSLETKATEIEELYHEKVPILTARDIRNYLRQIREAVSEM